VTSSAPLRSGCDTDILALLVLGLIHLFGGIIAQLAVRCSKSVMRCRKSRNSRCICAVALPTKMKQIGKNAKKAGRHQPESAELMEANKAMSEMNAQKTAGIQ